MVVAGGRAVVTGLKYTGLDVVVVVVLVVVGRVVAGLRVVADVLGLEGREEVCVGLGRVGVCVV